ncbi:unnamed protein product [Linum tenue]|uniref:DDE Tnp4 domain-containing protein n=2 Tax=Linum tenue TaxID=586396 RepID=A0AAV0MMJ6_9ROSI|nr:unnamed protein product [Linum tenue]
MESTKKLAALLCSLASQLLALLLLLFPSSSPHESANPSAASAAASSFLPLIHHFLSSQEIAAFLTASSRKRKRTQLPDIDSHPARDRRVSELDRVAAVGTRGVDSFRSAFKMSSSTFEWLCGLLEPLLECRDPIDSPLNLSPELRLGIGMFRLATGSGYAEIANRFGVTESAARFCSKQLSRVLCTNFRFWVGFPPPEELNSVSKDFLSLTGLPNCCGVIACTRFTLVGHETLAVQLVVDSNSRILSIVAGFRGDKSDSQILKSTTLYKDIEERKALNSSPVIVEGVAVNQYLVGGRGYPLLPWLFVPFGDDEDESFESRREKEMFNATVDWMRVSAARAIGSLRKWGVLSMPIGEDFKTAVGFVGACSILHNVLLMREGGGDVDDFIGGDDDNGNGHLIEEHWDLFGKQAADARLALAKRVAQFKKS